MSYIILFLVGLLIGSFLNVVALRYREGATLLGSHVVRSRSHCQTCQVPLKWYELVPLFSFIVQGAKCRHCKHSLNWQYPIVELVTGLLTAAVPWLLYSTSGTQQLAARSQPLIWFYLLVLLWLLATYTLITLAAIDLRLKIIPDQSNVLLLFLGILLVLLRQFYFTMYQPFTGAYAVVLGLPHNIFLSALIAVLVALILFGGTIWLTKGRGMGLGDLKLAIPIALLLGWPDALLAFVSAFVIGAFVGLLILAGRRATMKSTVPFGPFLVLGVYVAMFYGESILRWYFGLI